MRVRTPHWFGVAVLSIFTLAVAANAERPPAPQWVLAQCAFQLEVTVLSIEEKSGPGPQTTSVWHRVRVERVFVGSGLKPGDEAAVVSLVFSNPQGTPGSSGDRGPFAGHGPNGLPTKGDRARLFAHGTAEILTTASPNGWQLPEPLISFVAADDEYRSEITMPMLARLVEGAHIARTQLHFATGTDGAGSSLAIPDVTARTGLTSDRALGGSDATVLFMRFRELQNNTMIDFANATMHGLPVVGFRTSTHAFRFPDGPAAARWNEQFPTELFGTAWKFHHGHTSKTRILPPDAEAAKHPVLAGVKIPSDGITLASWLYQVEPLPEDCRVLLWGESIGSERKDAPQRQPILWVREVPRSVTVRGEAARLKSTPKTVLPPQRIAFTTLGHPGDFACPEVRVIAVQMVAWATDESAKVDDAARDVIRAEKFDPPPTR